MASLKRLAIISLRTPADYFEKGERRGAIVWKYTSG